MSIYSGFPTRKDETLYNQLLEKLIQTLQHQLLSIIQTHGLTLQKSFLYEKIIRKMRQFQQHKYLEPKFSAILLPLANFIGMPEKLDIIPEHTQTRYQTPKQKLKSETSYSHSVFSSKKSSNGCNFNEVQRKKMEQNDFSNHQTKVNIFRTDKKQQLTNSRKQYKKGHHQSFYTHKRRSNILFHRKIKDRSSAEKNQEKHKPNYRSVTQSKCQGFNNKTRQYCIDLKVLREAEQELIKSKNAYKITAGNLSVHH